MDADCTTNSPARSSYELANDAHVAIPGPDSAFSSSYTKPRSSCGRLEALAVSKNGGPEAQHECRGAGDRGRAGPALSPSYSDRALRAFGAPMGPRPGAGCAGVGTAADTPGPSA